MDPLNTALAVLGLLTLLLGVSSGIIKTRLSVSEPTLATVFGFLVGPVCLGWFDPSGWGGLTTLREVARLTLAVTVVGVAMRLPDGYFRKHALTLALLLGTVMPAMWLTSSLIFGTVLSMAPVVALAAGASVTPTDPVVASSIVTGPVAERSIPARLRNLLSAEAGANDALGYAIVALPVLVMTEDTQGALSRWVVHSVLWETCGAVAIGLAVGWGAGLLHRRIRREAEREPTSVMTSGLALSFAVLGAVKLLDSDGILAAFAAGMSFSGTLSEAEEHQARREHLQEAVKRFFDIPVFVIFGAMLPVVAWSRLGWRGVVAALLVLLFRRLPWVLLLRRRIVEIDEVKSAAFLGWFGPIGVAAVYYSTLAVKQTGDTAIWDLASLVVASSLVFHGMSATPITRRFRVRASGSDSEGAVRVRSGVTPAEESG